MKRALLTLAALLIMIPVADARRKKDPAGTVQDGVFVDATKGYQFKIHDNWQARAKKDEENFRVVLTQKKYSIPIDYQRAPDYTYIPRFVVYADTTSLALPQFLDSLLSKTFKSAQMSEIKSEFEFLAQPEIIPKERKLPQIAGAPGIMWHGEAKYMKEVSTSAAASGGMRVNSAYAGAIFGAKNRDGRLLLVHIMCEEPFHEDVFAEVNEMITSLTWITPEKGD